MTEISPHHDHRSHEASADTRAEGFDHSPACRDWNNAGDDLLRAAGSEFVVITRMAGTP